LPLALDATVMIEHSHELVDRESNRIDCGLWQWYTSEKNKASRWTKIRAQSSKK